MFPCRLAKSQADRVLMNPSEFGNAPPDISLFTVMQRYIGLGRMGQAPESHIPNPPG